MFNSLLTRFSIFIDHWMIIYYNWPYLLHLIAFKGWLSDLKVNNLMVYGSFIKQNLFEVWDIRLNTNPQPVLQRFHSLILLKLGEETFVHYSKNVRRIGEKETRISYRFLSWLQKQLQVVRKGCRNSVI